MTATRYPFTQMRERLRGRDDVLDFAIGAGAVTEAPDLVRLIREDPGAALERSDTSDTEGVQRAAATFLAGEYGVEVDAGTILPAPGGRSALAAVIASLLASGDVVVHTDPAYPTFATVAARAGVRLEPMALEPARLFEPDVSSVGEPLPDARMVSLNFPNNPTGALLPDGLISELGTRLGPDGIIFNDATLGPLTYRGPSRSILSNEAGAGVTQPRLELHSIGKLIGVLGVPLSFLVGSAEIVERVRGYTDYVWTPPSRLQSRLATACLHDVSTLKAARERCRERMSALVNALEAIGLSPYPAPSGLYVLCPVPERIAGEPVDGAQAAADALFEKFSLAVMAWDASGEGYLRFSSLYRAREIEALAGLGSVT